METVQDPGELETEPKKKRRFAGQINWRMILVRLVVNGLTLIAIAAFVPNIYFVDKTLVSVLLMAFALGILNAFVKPIIQFLTLPFVFATYGFAIVVINTIILLLLAIIFEERFYVGSLAAAIVGGLVMGFVASLLESLLGLDLPIVSMTEEEGNSPAPVSQTIERKLVDRVSGDEAVQPALSEDISEPTQTENSGEPPMSASAEAGESISTPADDEESSPAAEEGPNGSVDDGDDKQAGDER